MLLHCLMWFVWRERNTRTFEGMKDRFMSWSFSAFILCLNRQILWVFLLSTLCLICFFFVLSLLLSFYFFVAFSTLPVCIFPLYFLISYFNEFYYQKKKKKKKEKETIITGFTWHPSLMSTNNKSVHNSASFVGSF